MCRGIDNGSFFMMIIFCKINVREINLALALDRAHFTLWTISMFLSLWLHHCHQFVCLFRLMAVRYIYILITCPISFLNAVFNLVPLVESVLVEVRSRVLIAK